MMDNVNLSARQYFKFIFVILFPRVLTGLSVILLQYISITLLG